MSSTGNPRNAARQSSRPPCGEPARLVVPGPHSSVVERLTEVAGVCGHRVALESVDTRLTFAELDERMRAIAADLVPRLAGLAPAGEVLPVGVLTAQGADGIAAMMGVLAAGQPFVALDTQLPEARLHQIAERAGVRTILADAEHRDLAATFPDVRVVRPAVPEHPAPAGFRPVPVTLDDPASLIFTSGTTGVPKGVVYSHRTVLACGFTGQAAHRITTDDRIALVLPQAFAAGQLVFLASLLNGATLCIRDPRAHGMRDVAAWVAASRITALHLTPSLLRALVEVLPEGTLLESIRLVTTAGEKVYGRDVRAIRPFLPETASFQNWMGSSETEALTSYEVKGADTVPEGILPAGQAVPLRRLEILGDDGQPLPTGTSGVLHVVSAHMSVGYWRDPESTAKVFTLLPDGQTRFRTGDRARVDDEGNLHLLGRADDAVKIRGYLVEPHEVEAALLRFPEIADAVVRATGPEDALALVAWVVPNPQHHLTPSPASVRSTLARLLPAYMVPTAVVMMTEMPRNERGKVAIRELPPPPPRPEPTPPATVSERAVAAIWAPILRLETVGRDESFTALGGDSLGVEEMLAAVQSAYDVSLTTADLVEHPSLRDFAALLDGALKTRGYGRTEPLVTLRAAGTRPPLFCFSGAGGAAVLFEHLAAGLGDDQPVHAFQVNGLENPGLPDWTIGAAARRYAPIVQRLAPSGPLVLAGHSLGGLFALRVAQLLSAQGRDVALLVLIDTFLPPAARGADAAGSPLVARIRRSRPGLIGAGLYDFLVPTTIRRRSQQRRRDEPAGTEPTPRPERAYLRTRLGILAAGLTTSREPSVRKDVFNLHGIGITQFHRPRPWQGDTVVFCSRENHDDPRWWAQLLPGRHEIRRIEARHVAVLKPPYVQQVIQPLQERIDAISSRAQAGPAAGIR